MNQKPSHLGLKYAEQFKDPGLVAVYHYRRPYPDEAINKLVALVTDEPHAQFWMWDVEPETSPVVL